MTSTVRDFLVARRAEIDVEIGPLVARERELLQSLSEARAQIDHLFRERDEVVKAASALGLEFPRAVTREQAPESTVAIPERLSLQAMALKVIEDVPDGLSARDVLSRLNRRFNVSFPRTSLSPQLSRLKRARRVVLRGGLWTAARPRDDKGPNAPTFEPSVSTSVTAGEPHLPGSLFSSEEPRFPSRDDGLGAPLVANRDITLS